jgi:ATP-dependent helicase/nuclease subunit B
MQSFLSKVVSEVLKCHTALSRVTIILPNKRSGLFLKNILKQEIDEATFLPRILSIEEFVKEVSNFELLDNVSLLFEFYGVYKLNTPKGKTDSFEAFSKWASILLQDFNDLDSNLFDSDAILTYLNDSKRLEQWNLTNQYTGDLIQNYLSFFEKIKIYHQAFWKHLCHKKIGYQGLVYRIASENIEIYRNVHQNERFVFAGFNALNKCEETIMQNLLFNQIADIYWDHDDFYEKSNNQSQQFFKKYKREWPYYLKHDFKWTASDFNKKKTIHLHGLPKNISQIKHAGSLLKELHENKDIEDTAIILGNEKLLPSLLNSIPENISKANITMGYELQNVALSSLFESIFKLHLNKKKWKKERSFYYKDLISIINDPFFQTFWLNNTVFEKNLKILLFKDKSIFVTEKELMDLVSDSEELKVLFKLIFLEWDKPIDTIINRFVDIIDLLRKLEDQNNLYQEFLYRFYNIFVQLHNLNRDFGFIDNVNTLYQIFQQILKTEKLSFQGEPLQGLQIMGLLESRVLDFKTVIITSVNEGFLPTAGSNNSFIPLDIKLEKKMPTFFERDAIFSYHFFRLFHRAEHIYLIYNNITDDFGSGEPSRFIRQLETAKELGHLDQVQIAKKIISPKLHPLPLTLNRIEKTQDVLMKIEALALNGFSPSSLGNYIRNPLDFYKRSILGIKEFKEVEESIAANTFGTIIHETLQNLYHPYVNKPLSKLNIIDMKGLLAGEVQRQFEKCYSSKSIETGTNFLSLEIAKQLILNFLNYELSEIKKGRQIRIIGLEEAVSIKHPLKGISFPVRLKGIIDRIDEVDGVMRIIDYKTGKVDPSHLKIKDWDLLTKEEKFTKGFQVLTYAYMYKLKFLNEKKERALESGIISFKNLKFGFMKLNGSFITDDILESYVAELNKLLFEIFDINVPFEEKELPLFNF